MASLTIAIVTINPKISGAGQGAKTNEHSEKTTVIRIGDCDGREAQFVAELE
jgi:hypothetical protein